MSGECSCRTMAMAMGLALLTSGVWAAAPPAQAATFKVPVVQAVKVDPPGLLVVGQQAWVACQIGGGDLKTLSAAQEQFLASHGGKVPAEFRVDGTVLKSFPVGPGPKGGWYETSTSWTPGAADAGKTHQLTCVIDPQGEIKESSSSSSSMVVAKLPNAPQKLPGALKSTTGGAQSKPSLAIPHGSYAVKPKSPSTPVGPASGVAVSPLPELAISDLKVIGSTGCFPDGYRNFTLRATVTNQGAGPVEKILGVRFHVDQVAIPGAKNDVTSDANVTGNLASGMSTPFQVTLKKIGGLKIGKKEHYFFEAEVDPGGFVQEVNEQNNHKQTDSWLDACATAANPAAGPSHPGGGTGHSQRLPTSPQAASPARGSASRLALPTRSPATPRAHEPSAGTR